MSTVKRILRLKEERKATILAHNYQSQEIQFVADFVGDTLSLSTLARDVDKDVIVFCGPDFMVETAKVLSSGKIVVYANERARCPMAAMVTREQLRRMKRMHPDAKVVGYINTSAECKCEMDICCTSSNAAKIIRSLDAKDIIFVPDKNLGSYLKRMVPDKQVLLWPGFCAVHQTIRRADILRLSHAHPNAEILIHPECAPNVVELADAVLSTDGMLNYVAKSLRKEFIIGTELELVCRLVQDNPDKKFYPVRKAYCRTQKKIRLENVLSALETLEPKVDLPDDIIEGARVPLERMLSMGRGD